MQVLSQVFSYNIAKNNNEYQYVGGHFNGFCYAKITSSVGKKYPIYVSAEHQISCLAQIYIHLHKKGNNYVVKKVKAF